jgi:dienelactone hydrolase
MSRPGPFLVDLAGARVPAILTRPATAGPAPAVLMLHGYSSRKERMAETVGAVLQRAGIASLAIDLPLHGERGRGIDAQAVRNPLQLAEHWRRAVAECGAALAWLAAHDDIDESRLTLLGYSMGAFLACEVAARERTVRALVLAAGGDLPKQTPFAMLVRAVADPVRAIRRYAGRPLLMVNGRHDTTVRPDQAERLYAAAGEPKELRWYDAGHYLPPRVVGEAAEWMAATLLPSQARRASG